MSIIIEPPKATIIQHNNDDLHIVNAARVSFDKHKTILDSSDKKGSDKNLINYLARSKLIHFTPFTHVRYTLIRYMGVYDYIKWLEKTQDKGFYRQVLHTSNDIITFIEKGSYYSYAQMGYAYRNGVELSNAAFDVSDDIPNVIADFSDCKSVSELRTKLDDFLYNNHKEVPNLDKFVHKTIRVTSCISVARQLFKHKVDFTENEISRRYVTTDPSFYVPTEFSGKPINGAKQGSHGVVKIQSDKIIRHYEMANELYKELIDEGNAPEQARLVLPQAMNTSWYWTASLSGFKRVIMYRTDADTQKDTVIVGNAIKYLINDYI